MSIGKLKKNIIQNIQKYCPIICESDENHRIVLKNVKQDLRYRAVNGMLDMCLETFPKHFRTTTITQFYKGEEWYYYEKESN